MRYRATDARLAQITERKSSRLQNRMVTFPALRSVGSGASVSLNELSSNGCSSSPSSASTFPPGGAMFATVTVTYESTGQTNEGRKTTVLERFTNWAFVG